jgi:hypothetical protein
MGCDTFCQLFIEKLPSLFLTTFREFGASSYYVLFLCGKKRTEHGNWLVAVQSWLVWSAADRYVWSGGSSCDVSERV